MPAEVKHQSFAQLASKDLPSSRVMSYWCAALFTIILVLLECPEHSHTFGIWDVFSHQGWIELQLYYFSVSVDFWNYTFELSWGKKLWCDCLSCKVLLIVIRNGASFSEWTRWRSLLNKALSSSPNNFTICFSQIPKLISVCCIFVCTTWMLHWSLNNLVYHVRRTS